MIIFKTKSYILHHQEDEVIFSHEKVGAQFEIHNEDGKKYIVEVLIPNKGLILVKTKRNHKWPNDGIEGIMKDIFGNPVGSLAEGSILPHPKGYEPFSTVKLIYRLN